MMLSKEAKRRIYRALLISFCVCFLPMSFFVVAAVSELSDRQQSLFEGLGPMLGGLLLIYFYLAGILWVVSWLTEVAMPASKTFEQHNVVAKYLAEDARDV